MKIQYRTICRGKNDWYPQVRFGWWIFWFDWKEVYKFSNGFRLWYNDYWYFPQTKQEAEQTIKDYDAWRKSKKPITINKYSP